WPASPSSPVFYSAFVFVWFPLQFPFPLRTVEIFQKKFQKKFPAHSPTKSVPTSTNGYNPTAKTQSF
ncbi:MAG: hypothetical protein AAFW73_22040, partial [Bacteroidota bacterium]